LAVFPAVIIDLHRIHWVLRSELARRLDRKAKLPVLADFSAIENREFKVVQNPSPVDCIAKVCQNCLQLF
jgi:hypothetical protein